MTTEEDFRRRLRVTPDDHDLRRVYGDWLEDNDDPRADGYWAMGLLEIYPRDSDSELGADHRNRVHCAPCSGLDCFEWWREAYPDENSVDEPFSIIPWFDELQGGFPYDARSRDYRTRHEAEDAAAWAWVRLSPSEREKILKGART